MAFTSVPTVATGDTWTASQHNTYLRDNMAALWPYTATGDLAYSTSPSTLTNLAKPSTGAAGLLTMTSTGVPSWVQPTVANQVARFNGTVFIADYAVASASVYNTASFSSLSGGTDNALTFNSETVDTANFHSTVSNTGRLTASATSATYILFWQIACTRDSGGGTAVGMTLDAKVRKNGTTTIAHSMLYLPESVGGLTFYLAAASPSVLLVAGDYCELIFSHGDSATWQVTGGAHETTFGIIRLT